MSLYASNVHVQMVFESLASTAVVPCFVYIYVLIVIIV